MADEDRDLVRSYSRLHRFQRRLYRLTEEWAIPKPGGITYQALGYFCVMLAVVAPALYLMPGRPQFWPVWACGLAAMLSNGLLRLQPDGRPGHKYAFSWARVTARRVRDWARPRRHVHDFSLRCRWDAFAPDLRRARVRGPATVRFNLPVDTTTSGMHPHVRPGGEEGVVVELRAGEALEVKP